MRYFRINALLLFVFLFPFLANCENITHFKSDNLLFEENKGQIKDMLGNLAHDVLFKSSNGNLTLFITKNGITYCSSNRLTEEYGTAWERIDVELVGATISKAQVVKHRASTSKKNYYLGHCPNGIKDVRSYEKIRIKEVYPGIDWILYSKEGKGFKYDFEVSSGIDPSMIQLRYISRLPLEFTENGSLLMETAQGKIQEHAPISYQGSKEIVTKFKKRKTKKEKDFGGYLTEIDFELGNYDINLPLTIDPALQWATMIDGEDQRFPDLATDALGNTFLAGRSAAIDFPVQNNGTYFQGTTQGFADGIIMKFSTFGELIWSTYYGGSGNDIFTRLTTDQLNNVIVTGHSLSNNFPLENAYQTTISGNQDFVLLKFDNNGERIFSTYFGGSDSEYSGGITVDQSNNIYISGATRSNDLPIPGGTTPFQGALNGTTDAFIAKFTSSGVLEWSSYYGGSSSEGVLSSSDGGKSEIACDNESIFLFGETSSTDLPVANAFQPAHAGGDKDAFIAKFDLNGNGIWNSYLGGDSTEIPHKIVVDTTGDLYLVGYTRSADYPTLNALQPSLQGGRDVFLTKMDTSGNMIWSTYLGGSGNELGTHEGIGMVIDDCNNIYVSYSSDSPDIVSGATISSPCPGEFVDDSKTSFSTIVISRLSSLGDLLWVSYYGSGETAGYESSLAIDKKGNVLLAGSWKFRGGTNGSASLMEMSGAYNSDTFYEAYNMYLARFGAIYETDTNNVSCYDICDGSVDIEISGGCPPYSYEWEGVVYTDTTGTITITGVCIGEHFVVISPACSEGDTVYFTLGSGSGYEEDRDIILCEGDSIFLLDAYQTTEGTYVDTVSCDSIITHIVTLQEYADATINTLPNEYCYKDSTIQLSVQEQGGTWTGSGLIDTEEGIFSIATALIGDNELIYTIEGNCGDKDTTVITIQGIPILNMNVTNIDCENLLGSIMVEVTGTEATPYNYNWSTGETDSLLTELSAGSYELRVTDNNGCFADTTIELLPVNGCEEVYAHIPNSFSPNGDGQNDIFSPVFNDLEELVSYGMSIYNRWGELIFETNTISIGWDGTFKGKLCSLGTYNYVVKFTNHNEEEIPISKEVRGVILVVE